MTTESNPDIRARLKRIEATHARLDARTEEQRRAAVAHYNRQRFSMRNIVLGFRDAAREARRLWGAR